MSKKILFRDEIWEIDDEDNDKIEKDEGGRFREREREREVNAPSSFLDRLFGF